VAIVSRYRLVHEAARPNWTAGGMIEIGRLVGSFDKPALKPELASAFRHFTVGPLPDFCAATGRTFEPAQSS